MLIVITLATSRLWHRISTEAVPSRAARSLARAAVVTTCVIYAQLALGATMRHQHRDLAILDFPAAYGQLIPDVSAAKLAEINVWRDARALSDVTPFQIWLQMAHRFLALVIAAGVIVCFFRARATELRSTLLARFSGTWFLLLATQITLGAWVIWSNKAADIATAHVAIGATMLAFGVTISALGLRISSIACHPEPRRRRGTSQLQSTPAPSEEASISDVRSLTSFGMTRSTPLMSQTFNPS